MREVNTISIRRLFKPRACYSETIRSVRPEPHVLIHPWIIASYIAYAQDAFIQDPFLLKHVLFLSLRLFWLDV